MLFSKQLDLFLEWSAPSAIGIAGLGGGFEAGAEVTYLADLHIVCLCLTLNLHSIKKDLSNISLETCVSGYRFCYHTAQ